MPRLTQAVSMRGPNSGVVSMLRFAVLFVVYLGTLFFLNVLKPVQDHVITPFTSGLAWICTSLIHLFDSAAQVSGKVISSGTGWAVSIEPGCNGVEAVIILASAVFAFPAPWKHRLIGFIAGFFAIQGLNVVRIISLFYIGLWEHNKCMALPPGTECHTTWFDWFHLYLWQALIILDALVVWLIWLRYLPRDQGPRPPNTSGAVPGLLGV
jgi:exosortase H (IPTLxxWG-CTERM-specific)